jgi:DNA-binding MarR family transcriptional regulator
LLKINQIHELLPARWKPHRETVLEARLGVGVAMMKAYTHKQGQYLAFIYYYSKIHGCAPSEAELQQYFRVSPPSVHQMILTLEARGLIERTPGQARSIHLLIRREELPDLL